ncbi:DUF6396 domain-containing protein [Pseudomonas sp. 148P]|uniref:DUF6396 domain-containing protein n=2 Tax=Pseudomonas TaxID=286 RepID=A0ABU7I0E4_9PSED|nr:MULTISPECIES: DUF6396 domain-containing protein [unclassified Pseudomonas]MEE1926017.1 DUF6396 domain-containing protein [Pseudomonas sp. 147P]MEE1937262.1 DUF6396 domain-containing protein [Pseudomonas sp. 148P]
MRWVVIISFLLSVSCGVSNKAVASILSGVEAMSDIGRLNFSCSYEEGPGYAGDLDVLFRYARWLQVNNQLIRDEGVYAQAERLYRIASEGGHYKANINLQIGAMRGYFKVKGYERLRMSQELIDAKVAAGYLMVARMLQVGGGGLKKDEEMSLKFYRKAADEGNASAQAYVADKLASIPALSEVARDMRRCAAAQSHGEAAVAVALYHKRVGDYAQALELFQMGASAGNESAIGFLEAAFRGAAPEDDFNYLGQSIDLERAERYNKIWRVLANYSYANPVVPEINEIVPLPPAKLPPWDGKIKWLEDRLANIPPPKPEEWLIEKLAKEKGLDPATGRPLPGSPAFKAEYFPVDTCKSGEPCPQEGYWKVMWPERWVRNEEVIQHFNEGELMPHPEGNYYLHRIWPLPRKLVRGPIFVKWGLLG